MRDQGHRNLHLWTITVLSNDQVHGSTSLSINNTRFTLVLSEKHDNVTILLDLSRLTKIRHLRLKLHIRVFTLSSVQLRGGRSEEHTSELQSRGHLVCRL